MRDLLAACGLIALLALSAALFERLNATETAGRARIGDGDSITIAGERVRLRGIDAPEFDQHCTRDGKRYPCGRTARDALAALVQNREVKCRGWEHDRYGRLLARCMADDIELNRAMVEAGWAVAYGDYREAERQARETRSGLWAGSFDPPQKWRRVHGGLVEDFDSLVSPFRDWLRRLFGLT